jgi:hypothetical protein
MPHTDDPGDLHGHHTATPDPNLDLLVKLGYDTRDVPLQPLVRWLGGLAMLIVVATLIGFGLFKWLVPSYSELTSGSPLPYVRLLPPNPEIQVRPRRDMIDYWTRVDPIVKGYTAGDNGRVNLPIGRAMDLMARKGISGVTGDNAVVASTDAYPGSGKYTVSSAVTAPPQGMSTSSMSPTGSSAGNDANFEGGGTPNPFRDHPVPSPYEGYPAAPGVTDMRANAPAASSDDAAATAADGAAAPAAAGGAQ